MRSVTAMRAAKIGYIIMSALFCVTGLVLMLAPETALTWLGRLLGIFVILFGGIKLVGYFSRDLFRLAFQYDFAFGILLVVLGILTLSHPNSTMNFLAVILGIPVLADGLFKIQIALDSQRFGIRCWWLILILAVLTCVVGIILVFRPAVGSLVMTIFMGASLLLDGILNLCVALFTVKIVANQWPDVPEYEAFKIND